MTKFFPWWKGFPVPVFITFIYFVILSAVNLFVGLQVLRDPAPFASSYWDIRWALIFAVVFFIVGLLSLLSQHKALIILTLVAGSILVILPVFTIGAGAAYLMLALLVLIAYGLGEFMLRILLGSKVPVGLERFALAVLLGLGLIAALVMIQGMLFAYKPLVTWLGLAGLTLVFVVPNLKRWLAEAKEHFSGLRSIWSNGQGISWAFVLGILTIIWVPSWLIALAPANRYDEMTYHLVAPLYYLNQGGIVPFPEGWMHYAEMLYTLALQTAGQPLPRMLHLLMGALSALLVFLFGRRLVNARVGVAAAILFFAVPAIGYESATAYIDLFVTAYTTAFGFTLLVWWQERNPRWLLAAGVLGGLGLGTKLTAGPMIAGLIVAFIIVNLIEHRFSKNLLWTGAMFALILAFALPWLIRDTLWKGDPFYPFGNMFMAKVTSSMSASVSAAAPPGSSMLLRLLRYPIDLVFNSYLYYREAPGGFASALPLLALPLFTFFPSFSRRIKAAGVGLLIISFLAIGIMILVNSVLLRYAMPIFSWLAICAALNLEGVYAWFMGNKSGWGTAALCLTLLAYVFSTRLPLIMRPYDNLPQRFPVNYVLGRENREVYLSRTLGVYDAFRFIDSQPGGPHKVLSIGNEFRLYVKSQIDAVYDVVDAHEIVSKAETPAELSQSMGQSGYDFILINQLESDFVAWKYKDPYPILQNPEFWNSYGELVFAKKGIYVYRFDPKGVELPTAVNLLRNGGFEEVKGQSDFADWEENGAVELSDQAFQGKSSLLIQAPFSTDGGGYVMQRVPVEENQLYTLGYWIKSEHPATFLMQVRWLDDKGNVINIEEDWKNTSPAWQWYSLFTDAPEGAQFAEVYASLGGSENALVDAVCLAIGQRCPEQ